MAWLSSGGTAFSYRMSIPVANPSTQGDRIIDNVPFPGWFLRTHPSGAKILQAAFQDVHVTKADGTTELPCSLNTAKNALNIDFVNMPVGRTTLYVYYGHGSVAAPTAPSLSRGTPAGESGGTLLDSGFEYGVDGDNLTPALWTSFNTPQRREIDTAQAKVGTRSAWIKGPADATWAGVKETTSAGMAADTAEYRFWTHFGSLTGICTFTDNAAASPGQFFYLRWGNTSGVLEVYTDRSATGYTQAGFTQIGTLSATTWYQFRLVFNFTADTWQLSYRTALGTAWTLLKAAGAPTYDIPARGTDNHTQNDGLTIMGYNGAEVWVDAIQYANGGITDTDAVPPVSAVVQVLDANDERTAEDDDSGVFYLWGENLEATYLASDAAGTYYGAATNCKAGWNATGSVKDHALLKFFEGALPKGTVADSKLHVYLESAPTNDLTLHAHRLKTTAGAGAYGYVQTGWGLQSQGSTPTWTNRMTDFQASDAGSIQRAWLTAGASDANEIDLTEHVDLAVTGGQAAGYVAFALTPQWLMDWQGDIYSQGLLIKDSAESGTRDSICTFTRETQTNSPVLEVTFSALAAQQLSKRKRATNTYYYATFSTHHRYTQIPSTDGFAVVSWVNCNMGVDLAYVTPGGRYRRIVRDTKPPGSRLNNNSPCYGLYYDPDERRYWLAGNKTNNGGLGYLMVAYSDPYLPTNWTWAENVLVYSAKSAISPRNGVVLIVNYAGSETGGTVDVLTFTRTSGAFSAVTNLVQQAFSGTLRNLSVGINVGDTMSGAGTIVADGTIADYPAAGSLLIATAGGVEEAFWYTGKSGNSFTGVTRAIFGTSAQTLATGLQIQCNRGPLTYVAIAEDAANSCVHVAYSVNSLTGYTNISGTYGYTHIGYIRHNNADGATTWKDENAVNILTLPVTQKTERVVPHAAGPVYYSDLLALSNGDVLVAGYQYGIDTGNAFIWRLPDNLTTWGEADIVGGNSEGSFVDIVGAGVVCTGVDLTTDRAFKRRSDDSGVTWGPAVDLFTYSLPAGDLWCSSMSYQGNLGSRGLFYAQHFCPFGAVYDHAVDVVMSIARPHLLNPGLWGDLNGGLN